MSKPTKSKGASSRKPVPPVRRPERSVSAVPVRAVKLRPEAKSVVVSPGRRVLVSGRTRSELRRLGEALAAEVHQSLYRVDLSRVVSQYIGETEKNLERVFDLAKSTGAILFFDEGDALFGRRTKTKDGYDRYANQEASFLLERIESYPGLVILATNRRENLDEAILRRLRFIAPGRRRLRRAAA